MGALDEEPKEEPKIPDWFGFNKETALSAAGLFALVVFFFGSK